MKLVIQTFKAPDQWVNSPPGLGDFVRGACHLFEALHGSGIGLRIDVSQTGFADYIEQDASIFHVGEKDRIAHAEEYFVDHMALRDRLVAFLQSNETELYVCTNLGGWNRLTLPDHTREFIKKFYRFVPEIERRNAQALQNIEYEVLSVRCGDRYYSDDRRLCSNPAVEVPKIMPPLCSIIEESILPGARSPVVVTCDSHELKCDLVQRYGLKMLPHRSQHGALGNALPVAMDLCMLKNSKINYHVNTWATWWSGFSHYTSVIFRIPSVNFRAPHFAREEISASGLFTAERPRQLAAPR
jgi:hypothetical protein